jgi:hypothetical protein
MAAYLNEVIERERAVLAESPDKGRSLYKLGWALYQTGAKDEAVRCLRAVIESQPDLWGRPATEFLATVRADED